MTENITKRKLLSVSGDLKYKYKVNDDETNLINESIDNSNGNIYIYPSASTITAFNSYIFPINIGDGTILENESKITPTAVGHLTNNELVITYKLVQKIVYTLANSSKKIASKTIYFSQYVDCSFTDVPNLSIGTANYIIDKIDNKIRTRIWIPTTISSPKLTGQNVITEKTFSTPSPEMKYFADTTTWTKHYDIPVADLNEGLIEPYLDLHYSASIDALTASDSANITIIVNSIIDDLACNSDPLIIGSFFEETITPCSSIISYTIQNFVIDRVNSKVTFDAVVEYLL